MKAFEGVGIALESIRASKGRAALTILGVAIGVAVVMIMASIITGINHGVTDMVEQLGPRTFFLVRNFEGGIDVSEDERLARRRRPRLTLEEANRVAQLSSIEFAVVREFARSRIEFENRNLESVIAAGQGPEWLSVSGGEISTGRTFTRVEAETGSRVAVVNERLSDELFGRRDPIGKRIKISGVPYRVIGLYIPPPELFGETESPRATIPHNTFDKHIPRWQGSSVSLALSPIADVTVQTAIDDVTGALRGMRGLKPAVPNNFDTVTQDKLLEIWQDMSAVFFMVMIALSSIGLLVGGVGVVAIMMISVTERTREIGVRMALGAKRYEILWQFLVEAATLTMVGGAIGMMLGGALTAITRAVTPLPAVVPIWAIVAALGVSAFTGVGFGLFPAIRASKLDPVEALRYE